MKVVVGYDGSSSAQRALERALHLFGAGRPEVILVRAVTQPMTSSDLAAQAFEAARDEARDELEAVVGEVNREEVAVRALIREGEPRQVLERMVEEEEPDVVVVGARGQGAAARLLLGSVSTYAVHHFPCPVLVVR